MIQHTISAIIIFLFLFGNIVGQDTDNPKLNQILDQYLIQGLKNNQSLQQANFSYQKSISALKEARGLFFPSVDISARYSLAKGGREFEFPLGDLMNPVYSTLNDLTGSSNFPSNLRNQSFPLLREKEHDTKISITQPLFKPEIYYNFQIKKQLMKLEENSRDIYARQLVNNIKTAYYNFLKTIQVVKLLDRTKLLLQENLRISNSLLTNHKVTKEFVYRARAELSKLEQEKAEAHKNKTLAASYFNFLLNKKLNTPIEITGQQIQCDTLLPQIKQLNETALNNREEIESVDLSIELTQDGIQLNRSNFLPDLVFAFAYGYQGEEYRFNNENDYWMASAVLQWNLFKGFQDKEKIQQARMEKNRFQSMKAELNKSILLQVNQAYQNLIVGKKSLTASKDRLQSARNSYKIVSKKYKEGMASYIEYIDARTTMTQAEINRIVAIYDYQIKQAELEKIIANYPLNKLKNL